MPKYKFYAVTFPSSSTKSPGANFLDKQLENIDRIFKILHSHTDKSYDESPWQILNNLIRNNNFLFNFKISDIIPCTSTSTHGQLNQESSSILKGDSSSSNFTQNFPFVDGVDDAFVPKILEVHSISAVSQKSVEFCKNNPIEDDKMAISATKGDKKKVNPKDENKASMEFKEDIKVMIGKDLVQIRSVSIFKQAEFIGVELEIDQTYMHDESCPKKPKLESSPLKKITSLGKSEKMESPISSPLKQSTNTPPSLSRLNVDYSDLTISNFLTERLLSILSCRKKCLTEIGKYFEKCNEDASTILNTMKTLIFVVDNIPKSKEPYVTANLLKLHDDLIKKSLEIKNIAQSWLDDLKDVSFILGNCRMEICRFDKEYAEPLSETENNSAKLTSSHLNLIESHLNDIASKMKSMMAIKDKRRTVLLNFLPVFEWYVNHFVKYLIITGKLKPLIDQSGKDK